MSNCIDSKILQMYYKCCIGSLLTVSFVCWYGSLCVQSKRVLSDMMNVCSNFKKPVLIVKRNLHSIVKCRMKDFEGETPSEY